MAASTSISKEPTPTTSDVKADTTNGDEKKEEKPAFTEKEERVLKAAWNCLKTGVPEIDMDKLTEFGGFGSKKTAQNTWAVIKKKLASMAPPSAEGEDAGGSPKTPKTPKAKATPKKRGKKADADEEEAGGAEDSSPTKKRKTPVKKPKKVEQEADPVKEELVDELA